MRSTRTGGGQTGEGPALLLHARSGSFLSSRSALLSLCVHAALLGIAVWIGAGVSRGDSDRPVQLTFFDPPPPPPEPEGGGGGGDPAPAPEPPPPAPAPPPRVRPPEQPRLVEPVDEPFNPQPILAAPCQGDDCPTGTDTGETGSGGSGTGSGGGVGSGVGTGHGSGVGPGTAAPRPIYLPAGMRPPRRIVGSDPSYTRQARAAEVEGNVVVRIEIGADGSVLDVTVLTGIPLLNDSVISTVRQWRFSPPVVGGRAVPIFVIQRITFEL